MCARVCVLPPDKCKMNIYSGLWPVAGSVSTLEGNVVFLQLPTFSSVHQLVQTPSVCLLLASCTWLLRTQTRKENTQNDWENRSIKAVINTVCVFVLHPQESLPPRRDPLNDHIFLLLGYPAVLPARVTLSQILKWDKSLSLFWRTLFQNPK